MLLPYNLYSGAKHIPLFSQRPFDFHNSIGAFLLRKDKHNKLKEKLVFLIYKKTRLTTCKKVLIELNLIEWGVIGSIPIVVKNLGRLSLVDTEPSWPLPAMALLNTVGLSTKNEVHTVLFFRL